MDAPSGRRRTRDGGTTTGDPNYPLTDVGAYTLSGSPYGTFDQGGNLWEWNETIIFTGRGIRGGSWDTSPFPTASTLNFVNEPFENHELGFRLASPFSEAAVIPEPSTLALAALGLLSLGMIGRRRRNRRLGTATR